MKLRNVNKGGSRTALVLVFGIVLFVTTGCGASITPMQPRTTGPQPTGPNAADVTLASPDFEFFSEFPLMVPVEGIEPSKIPDTFYDKRSDGRIHQASDILAQRNTPVLAATAGRIIRMSQNALGGITIYEIDDAQRFIYYYAHLESYADRITVGLRVEQGDVIGYVGTSGNAPPDTPHLHFQAMRYDPKRKDWWNGTPVDIRPFLRIAGKQRTPGNLDWWEARSK